jgi:acyl-CoA thioesterase
MSSFSEIVARLAPEGDGFVLDAPEEWSQGRTLFGGMTAALAQTSARRAFDGLPPLRSVQVAFVGPAMARLRFSPVLLRRGRSSAVVAVDCTGEDGLAARVTLIFGAARESVVAHDLLSPPEVPPPEACEPFHRTTKPLPGFLARFEFRHAAGARLFEPGATPDFSVWVRLRDGDGDDPDAALLALGDALPAAAMAAFPRPAPLSTMTWQIDLHRPARPAPDGWRLARSTSESAGEGYSLQAMRLTDRAGTPLASARQLVTLFV